MFNSISYPCSGCEQAWCLFSLLSRKIIRYPNWTWRGLSPYVHTCLQAAVELLHRRSTLAWRAPTARPRRVAFFLAGTVWVLGDGPGPCDGVGLAGVAGAAWEVMLLVIPFALVTCSTICLTLVAANSSNVQRFALKMNGNASESWWKLKLNIENVERHLEALVLYSLSLALAW
jgi:lysylphosphatidylglycerol synthetase-like protein (DUF2156 family)